MANFDADALWRCFSLQCCLDTPRDIEYMSGQRFVNMMVSCRLPRRPDLSAPALRVVATAAARGHVTKQNYDRGHTATRIFNSSVRHELKMRVSTHGRKLSYNDFLGALMRVAKRVYRSERAEAAFEALLRDYVMPHAYSSRGHLPFGISAAQAARVVSDSSVVALLDRFGPSLLDVFFHANHRANKRHGMTRRDVVESAQATGAGVAAVSHSELLSYDDYLELCGQSFYFQHQQQQNMLSLYHLGQVFVCVKEGGGHGLHPGHITFDEFLLAFCLLALSMSFSVARKYHVYPEMDIAASNTDMIKALLHRMASCPGITKQKMRCYSKFKHVFHDMYRADGKPWRYLNVPGAPKRVVSPKKVMRRLSLTANGHVELKLLTDQWAGKLGFEEGNEDIYEEEDDKQTPGRGAEETAPPAAPPAPPGAAVAPAAPPSPPAAYPLLRPPFGYTKSPPAGPPPPAKNEKLLHLQQRMRALEAAIGNVNSTSTAAAQPEASSLALNVPPTRIDESSAEEDAVARIQSENSKIAQLLGRAH
jgi:hypothetical protein